MASLTKYTYVLLITSFISLHILKITFINVFLLIKLYFKKLQNDFGKSAYITKLNYIYFYTTVIF